jgi:DNA-binding winged helix-turn-helix (wHTH) protein
MHRHAATNDRMPITTSPRTEEQEPGRLVTREQITAAVWPANGAGSSNTVTVHIQRLRTRLGDDLHPARIIQTVRKKGYRLVPPPRRSRTAVT